MRLSAIVFALALTVPVTAQSPEPAKPATPPVVKEGYELIHQGRISDALQHFRKLEESEPGNKWSAKAMKPLTQAVQLEKIIALDEHAKWTSAADWLHKFYTTNKVPSGLLNLTERAYKKFPGDATWGVRYAQALSAANQDAKALAIYETLLQAKDDPKLHAIAGVLLARMQETDRAKKHLQAIPADIACATTTYNVACAWALLGDPAKASGSLTRSFELTPPSKLAGMKDQARADTDLRNLVDTEAMATALKAESKVGEAKAVDASCEGCPSKGSCSEEKSGGSCDEKSGTAGEKKVPEGTKK